MSVYSPTTADVGCYPRPKQPTTAPVWARALLVILLVLAAPAASHAISTLAVSGEMDQSGVIPLNPALEYVRVSNDLSYPDILALAESRWRPVEGARGFGYSDKVYWFRVRLEGLKRLEQGVHVRLNFSHHDLVHFMLVSEGTLLTRLSTGDSKPFGTRPADSSAFLLPLSKYSRDVVDLYVGIDTPGPLIVPLDLVTHNAQHTHDQLELAWFAGYFAVIGIIFLNNLVIYFFVRDRTYLYYLSYLLSVGVLVFVSEGAAFRYWWPDHPLLNNLAVLVTAPLTLLLANLFIIRFLNLREVGDSLDYRIGRGFVILFSVLILAAWAVPYHLQIRINLLCSLVAILFAFYLGIKYSYRGYRAARLFALAWFVYLVFVAIFILDVAGVIQPTVLTRNAFVIGSALELALLSIAFADRFNQEKRQRIAAQYRALEAQQRLNEQLDSLVQARTRDLEQANRQLERLSLSDSLTGLANRRYFDQQVQREYQRARRIGANLTLGIIDVDHFKAVNDTYGHDVGDRCLIAIARAIQSVVNRPTDIVARFGGEEIAVALPDCDPQGARTVAENICQAIAALVIPTDNGEIRVTASVGTATGVPSDHLSLERLQKLADVNLYRAKAEGRNRIIASAA